MSKKIASIIGKVILIIMLAIGILLAFITGMLGGSVLEVMKDTPEVNPETVRYEMTRNSVIVDEKGKQIDTIETNQYRDTVSIDEIPDNLINAFVSVEDERFYKHNGVDLFSMLGSLVENIKAGSIVRGGSTITQQLARNTYLSNDQTFVRKIKEIYLALEIEKYLSKEEILEAYLNRVFLGQNSYGVQAASQTYFSKDVSKLNLAQAASIAGIVQSPTSFSLFNTIKSSELTDQKPLGYFTISGEKYAAIYNPQPYKREKYVLSKMLELGYISKKEYNKAVKYDVSKSINPVERVNSDFSNYFKDLIQSQVVYKLMDIYDISEEQAWDRLYYGGLQITSTIDDNLQTKVEDLYNNFGEAIGDPNSLLDLNYDENSNIIDSDGNILYYAKENMLDDTNSLYFSPDFAWVDQNGNLVIASSKVELDSTTLVIKDYYDYDDENGFFKVHSIGNIGFTDPDSIYNDDNGNIVITKKYLDSQPDFYSIDDYGNIIINNSFYDVDEDGTVEPQSATVVLDHKTGEIKAIVGGRNQNANVIFNRAIDQPRQPGSSIKPLATYTPALDNGYSLASGIDDVPFMRNKKGEIWPNNVYGYYMGIVSLRDSIKYSINTNAVRTLDDIGIKKSKKYLEKFGIINKDYPERDNFVEKDEGDKNNDENLAAMGLGAMTDGLSVLDMTGAYGALANGGTYNEPLSFSKIEDSTGKTIFENKDKKTTEVTSKETAYQMTSALETSAEYYQTINEDTIPVAAKTGTSEDNTDFWTMGYTPYYTVGVWLGADNQKIKLNGYSTDTAAVVWNAVNNLILEDKDPRDFVEPDGIIHQEVDTISGKLPTDASYADPRGTVIEEIFSKDNLPKEDDDMHVWISVDTRNNLLASNITPQNLIGSRSFVDRKGSYDPSKWDYIYPSDWSYEVPSQYSPLGAEIIENSSNSKKEQELDENGNPINPDNASEKELNIPNTFGNNNTNNN
ncbi:MAG: transglycosylase domain-containing protein [Peptoniphilaceae bacterium]|nr:transglycosylase domain-containing protein [Peptoniphilaceae bacterium]MDD7383572.1 transglycosylase domain-containing protein [Peptoniphilaceae bacterium]MDY3738745.1 transglycosylase domain-containing protein [Peptoniphilaceae bacterium]